MTHPIYIDAGQVAARLGISRALFLRQRDFLEQQHAFPLPMPTCRCPMKWRAAAVDAWIGQQGLPIGQGMQDAATPQRNPLPLGNRAMMDEAARP